MKLSMRSTIIALTFLCLAAGLNLRALTPPPDGGYPGDNTAEGQNALLGRTTGQFNTAIGWFSLSALTAANFNTGIGAGTLALNGGDGNTAVGAGALLLNIAGAHNTAVGVTALLNNDNGIFNVANGDGTLLNNTSGNSNTATGYQALFSNTTGNQNTAIGSQALFLNTGDGGNTACGYLALHDNTTGSLNIALGNSAGSALTTGNNNIDIGNTGVAGESNNIRIGVQGTQTATFIAGINGASVMDTTVLVNADGQLGTAPSSQRFKDDIKGMANASEAILALKPVTFRYKQEIDPGRVPQFGLVAEEVEKVDRDLVTRDRGGKPYTVRYEAVNAMLLNEFLKEHKAFLEEQKKVEKLEAALTAVNQTLKAQEAKIQKISAQAEVSRPGPHVALGNQ